MRYLINNETKKRLEYPVKALLITKNFWEHFIFDCPDIKPTDDQQFALVMGFETELGYISLSELKPYKICMMSCHQKATRGPSNIYTILKNKNIILA